MDLPYHVPVLLPAVVAVLDPRPGQIFVDATLGGGGHATALASRLRPGGRLIGLDQDPDALAEAQRTLDAYADLITMVQARFDRLDAVLDSLGIDHVNGVLFDLGVSSHQLDTPARGFSFKDVDAPLDMRMNPAEDVPTAADLLNTLPERELTALIRDNSDEHWAARIAGFVAERRQQAPYATVGQLVDTVHAAIPARARPRDIHAATRTFQALRIAVNQEFTVLGHALESAVDRLTKGGTVAVLSYHSGEDRIVKQLFARLAGRPGGQDVRDLYQEPPAPVLELLTRKPVAPAAGEVAENPRARSAKLRAARRL